MKREKCISCESENILRGASIIDRGGISGDFPQEIKVYGNPEALIFKEGHSFEIKTDICMDCGFLMSSISKKSLDKLKELGLS